MTAKCNSRVQCAIFGSEKKREEEAKESTNANPSSFALEIERGERMSNLLAIFRGREANRSTLREGKCAVETNRPTIKHFYSI
jgi:hypothetical protein